MKYSDRSSYLKKGGWRRKKKTRISNSINGLYCVLRRLNIIILRPVHMKKKMLSRGTTYNALSKQLAAFPTE